jgi:hypothetical protein
LPSDAELLDQVSLAARALVLEMLALAGEVAPFGLTLDGLGAPNACRPAGELPEAAPDDLLDAVVARLQQHVATGDVVATAIGCALEGRRPAFALQVEVPAGAFLFVYPYERIDEQWRIGDAIPVHEPLFERLFGA